LNSKFVFCLMQTDHELSEVKFGAVKYHGHANEFYFKHYFLTNLLNRATVQNVEVMLGQTLNHSVKDRIISCSIILYSFIINCLTFVYFSVCVPPSMTFEPTGSKLLQHR
jgi:hypothetical protein